MDSPCTQCSGRCCRYFCFEIDKPTDFETFENLRWYVLHQGVTVHVDESRWFIAIDNPCKALGSDNRCTIYERRPMICRSYDTDGCDASGGDYEYQQFFKTPEEVDAFARKRLGAVAYERGRAKMEGKGHKTPAAVPAPKRRGPSQ